MRQSSPSTWMCGEHKHKSHGWSYIQWGTATGMVSCWCAGGWFVRELLVIAAGVCWVDWFQACMWGWQGLPAQRSFWGHPMHLWWCQLWLGFSIQCTNSMKACSRIIFSLWLRSWRNGSNMCLLMLHKSHQTQSLCAIFTATMSWVTWWFAEQPVHTNMPCGRGKQSWSGCKTHGCQERWHGIKMPGLPFCWFHWGCGMLWVGRSVLLAFIVPVDVVIVLLFISWWDEMWCPRYCGCLVTANGNMCVG